MLKVVFVIYILDILVLGLMARMMAAVCLGSGTRPGSDVIRIEKTKVFIKAFKIKMPMLLFLSILLTLTSAFLQNKNLSIFIPLLISGVILISSGIVSQFGNRPIDKQILRWTTTYIPDKWEYLLDRWLYFHRLRTILVLIVFVLVVFTFFGDKSFQ